MCNSQLNGAAQLLLIMSGAISVVTAILVSSIGFLYQSLRFEFTDIRQGGFAKDSHPASALSAVASERHSS